jgi:hypothetical protein
VSLSFTAPALPGEYVFYIVVVVGTQSATRPVRVVVVGEPEFRITSVSVNPLPCQPGNAYTQISVEASIANVGSGRGVAEVYADLADPRGYTFRVGVARVEVDGYKTASAFVGKATVPCPFSGKVRVYAVYNGVRHDYREVPVEIKAYEPREESCVCVARELCQEGGRACRLPDGREGVCCTRKPCTLFVKATGGAGRISVEIEGATGQVVAVVRGASFERRFTSSKFEVEAPPGLYSVEARDSAGCFGTASVYVYGQASYAPWQGPTGGGQQSDRDLSSVVSLVAELLPALVLVWLVRSFRH